VAEKRAYLGREGRKKGRREEGRDGGPNRREKGREGRREGEGEVGRGGKRPTGRAWFLSESVRAQSLQSTCVSWACQKYPSVDIVLPTLPRSLPSLSHLFPPFLPRSLPFSLPSNPLAVDFILRVQKLVRLVESQEADVGDLGRRGGGRKGRRTSWE